MKYEHSRTVELPAQVMWEALGHMDEWLLTLDTITAVRSLGDPASPFVVEGRAYEVDTPEGVTMHARITTVDAQQMRVEITAKAGPLRSELSCRVMQVDSTSSKVSRIQSYPGVVGRVFTRLKGKREQSETAAYLDAWVNYALTKLA